MSHPLYRTNRSALLGLALILMAAASPTRAATLFWDADAAATAATGGTGNWDLSSAIWRNGSAAGALQAWVDGSDAVFEGTAGTVTLTSPISANSLTFNVTGYTITGNTLSLAAPATLNAGAAANTTMIASVIAGSAGLSKTGDGNIVFTGATANTYTGTTTIPAGTLTLSKTAGVNAIIGDITIGDGTNTDSLELAANDQIADTAVINFTSGGSGNSAKFTMRGFNETVGGINTTIAGQLPVIQAFEAGGTALTSILTVNTNVDRTYDGVLRNAGGGAGAVALVKLGTGNLTLANGNAGTFVTYSGTTTVTAGNLTLSNLAAFNSPIATASNVYFDQGTRNLTLGVAISGTGNVRKLGTGQLIYNVAQSYTGATVLDAGILRFAVDQNLGGAMIFGEAAGSTNIGTLDIANVNATFGGAFTVRYKSAAGSTLAISASKTVTVNNNVTIGFNPAALDDPTLFTITGSGSFVVNRTAGVIQIGGGTTDTTSACNKATLDMSGLTTFTCSLTTGRINIGDTQTMNPAGGVSTLVLAANNTITATTVDVGNNGLPTTQVLKLGNTTNRFNVTNFNMGATGGGRAGGSVTFNTGTGTMVLRDMAGTGRAAVNMSTGTTATATTVSSVFDASGHSVDLLISTLTIYAQLTKVGISNNTFTFNTGTLDANGVVMCQRTATGTGTAGVASGTLNIGGGTVNIGAGGIELLDQNSTTAGTGVASTVNITGGTVTLGGDIVELFTGTQAHTGTLTLNGGVLNMATRAIGSGQQIDVLNFQSGTLSNVSGINLAAGLTKTSAGVLLLNGVNTYPGPTMVSQGTLGGSGSITSSVTLANAAILAPGEPLVAAGIGTFTIAGLSVAPTANLAIQLNNNTSDLLSVTGSGSVDLSSLNLALTATGTQTGEFTILSVPNGSVTGTFASVTGLPANYAVRYTPTQVMLVRGEMDVARGATAVPSGSTDTLPNLVVSVAAPFTYTINNNGLGTLNLTGAPRVLLSGFTNCTAVVSTQPAATVAAAGSTTTTIDVTPGGGGGTFGFTVSIVNDDANENPYTWTVTGTGIAPELDVTRSLAAVLDGGVDNVGGRTVGALTNIVYTLTNSGLAPLNITGVTIAGQTNCTAVQNGMPAAMVAPGNTTIFSVDVTPGLAAFSFTVSIDNNDFNENPYNFTVNGAGITPQIDVSRGATAIPDGGNDAIGSSFPVQTASPLTYTITNSGNDTLDLPTNAVTVGSAVNCTVIVSMQPPLTVPGGTSTTTVITFTPTAAGAYSFAVAIANDDLDENPYNFTVNGTVTPNIVVSPTSGLFTTESAGAATFTVGMTTIPSATVTIDVASTDTTEGTASTTQLVFPPTAAALTPQTVTITGQNDGGLDGDIPYTITLAPAVSGDGAYNGFDPADVSATNVDDEAADVALSPTAGLITTEAGGTATFTIRLTSVPTAPVTVAISSSNTAEASVAPTSITFQPDGTSVIDKIVTVTGLDDGAADGDVPYTIIIGALVTTDPNYTGVDAADITATNIDNDAAGFTVSPFTGSVTTEAGGTATFTVVMTSTPSNDVLLGISSSDTTEGTVSTSSLTFTPANARTPQTVTITGVDDSFADGNIPFTIVTAPAVSLDPVYSGRDPSDVNVINTDNDVAGFAITPATGLSTTEAGGSASFTVTLTSVPSGNVTITLSSSNTAEGTVSPATLIFVPTTALTPQTVTVTGVDDAVSDGSISYDVVISTAVSPDAAYNGFNPADVKVVNIDNDLPAFTSPPTATPNPALVGTPVTFTAAATPAGAVILWNFSDGTAGSGASITHTYSTPGLYPVTATVSNNGGPAVALGIDMFVAADNAGGGGSSDTIGVLVGGSGLGPETGSNAKLAIDHRTPSRSKFEGALGQIKFPVGVEPSDLLNRPGSLVVGTGQFAQEFFFTIDKRGSAKATGLPSLKFDFRRSTFKFKISGRPGLADYAETIGVVFVPGVKTGTPKVVRIPSTLKVGNVLLAMTFELKVQQKNTVSKGVLNR